MTDKVIKMDTKLSKKDRLKAELIEISPYVEYGDYDPIGKKAGCSAKTVERYLKGAVANSTRAELILKEAKKIAA